MSNFLLIAILVLNLYPFKVDFIKDKAENYYYKKFIDVKTDSGQKSTNLIINPVATKNTSELAQIKPKAYLSIDLDTGVALEEKNSQERLQIASLTKLMTAYVVLKEMKPEEVITVPNFALQNGDAVAGLRPGQNLTVSEALKGLLIPSGSDAAQTLAIANAGSVDNFVVKMNKKAKDLSLKNTQYSNPVGWDDENNYSSAEDVAILSRILLNNDIFKNTVSQGSSTITTIEGEKINVSNTNKLLSDNYKGVKTGYTFGAGECLASYYKTDNRDILTIIIGSNDRFGETREIIDWIFTHFSW